MPSMSYNNAEADARDRLTFFAARQRMAAGRPQRCPCCGRLTVKPDLAANAVSMRFKKIYVCNGCGSVEASGPAGPLSGWAAASDPSFRVEDDA